MTNGKPASEIADDQANGDHRQSDEAPRVPSNGGNNDGKKDSSNAERSATPKNHDTLDWANLVVLIFTFLAASAPALEAKRLADLTYDLVVDGRKIADRQARLIARSIKVGSDTMVSNARAWVVPREPYIGNATLGKPIFLNLRYANVGKEPALNLTIGQTEYMRLNASLLQNPPETAMAIGPNEVCKNINVPPTTATIGITVWPLPEPEERHYLQLAGFSNTDAGIVDENLINGKTLLAVKGCLGYRTFTEAHFTQFCFTARREPNWPLDQWQILDCLVGNSAN
jgi:hypothetical protein